MLTFRQFITESSWSQPNIFYHATYKDFDPKNLEPGSHLGTLQAAMAKVSDEFQDPHNSEEKRKIDDVRKKLKIHVYRFKGNTDSLEEVEDQENEWGKPPSETVKYRNNFEDPGSTSIRTGTSENELEHIHTFHAPKFLGRAYSRSLLGLGTPEEDREYLEKKGRWPVGKK